MTKGLFVYEVLGEGDDQENFWQKYNTNLDHNFEPTGIVLTNGTKYGRCKLCKRSAYLVGEANPAFPKVHKMWRHDGTGHTQCGTMREIGKNRIVFVESTK